MPGKKIVEDVLPVPKLASGTAPARPFPSKEERGRRSREHARAILLEAGYDPATIEQEVERFLAQPLLFDLPSFDELGAMHAIFEVEADRRFLGRRIAQRVDEF